MEGLMEKTVSNLRELVDTDTVIGKCIIAPDNSLVIPVSKISVGMITGSNEKSNEKNNKDKKQMDGGGAGASITPLGFLVLGGSRHQFININKEENSNKWTDLLGAAINVFTPEK
ncbi:MAG: hypothetical protein EOM87_08305 [Clostridia bacterium]|nr:hypothetical protein [Clostridia bacterium]